MTTETKMESAPTGAAEQQQVGAQEPGGQAAGQTGNATPSTPSTPTTPTTPAPTFTAEQQAHIDKVISDRLKRDRQRWQEEQAAKARAEQDAAEAERQKQQGEWEALARKQEAAATEAKSQVKELAERLERADGVIAGLVESRKAGLPEAMLKALDGRDIYDQLQLVDAFQASLVAAQAAAPTNGTPGRQATPPTPQPQGQRELTPEERRQRTARIW